MNYRNCKDNIMDLIHIKVHTFSVLLSYICKL